MFIEDKENKLLFFSLSTLPISIIIGASVSLINILIICLFYFKIVFIEKNTDHLNNLQVRLIFCLYLYLILNSIFSMDFQIGFARNFGFIRFFFLFICINYFFYKFRDTNKLLSIWSVVISAVILDIFVEFFTGTNIFGWGAIEINGVLQPDGTRVVSFFQDEPIVGGYILGFLFLIIGFYTTKYKNQKVIPLTFIVISLLAIFCTGERANTIRFILGIFLFLAILDYFKIRLKIIFLFLFIAIFFIVLNNSNYLKERYYGQIINQINTKEKFLKFTNENRFCICEDEYFLLAGSWMLLGQDLDYLLGYLNSKVALFMFSLISNSSGMSTTQWKKFALEKLPIPKNFNSTKKKEIEKLVQRMKICEKKSDYEDLIFKIDKIFYDFFELDKKEINIIENQ